MLAHLRDRRSGQVRPRRAADIGNGFAAAPSPRNALGVLDKVQLLLQSFSMGYNDISCFENENFGDSTNSSCCNYALSKAPKHYPE